MAELVHDCPRCGANRITFHVLSSHFVEVHHNWQRWYETFCICRHCLRSTIFVLSDVGIDEGKMIQKNGLTNIDGAINRFVNVMGFINLKSMKKVSPPEHMPKEIGPVFSEAATCLAVECFNAAGTMFRLCVDLATQPLLPEKDSDGLNAKIRRDLGLRLPWFFDRSILPEALRELSSCIREDGNDGAHRGSLDKKDAEDLLDFTTALLERIYTEPERLRLAKERREKRRQPV